MKTIIFAIIMILIYGCGSIPILDTPEVEDPAPVVKEVIDVNTETENKIKNNTDQTIEKADEIQEHAQDIINKVSPDDQLNIQDNVDAIDNNAEDIKGLQIELQEQAEKLSDVTEKLQTTLIDIMTITNQKEQLLAEKGELLSQNGDLQEELLKERDAKQQALFGKLIYLIIASVILGALCLVSAFKGESKAIWGAVGAGLVIIVSLSISFYMTEFALFGFVSIIGGLALVGWNAYKDRVNEKATEELVHTVEIAKEKLMPKDTEEIFGKQARVGQAHLIQSPSTVKKVQELRKKRRDDWEPIIKK